MFQTKFKVRSLTTGTYMMEPVGVAVLDNGDVLVTDRGKCCVHQFEGSGKYLGRFGQLMELKQPNGEGTVAVGVAVGVASGSII